ncbi:MAG: F0F1 ATP synthase subunit B [Rhizomicrobium sp.]
MILDVLRNPDFWEWVGFLAVIALFIWKKVPAFVTRALDRRAEAISKELDSVKRLREEAETVLMTYRERAQGAENETAAILDESRAENERFTAEARAQMQAQLERRARTAQERIAQAEANALAEIRALAADAAVAAAEKLIAARLGEQKAAALIAESIDELSSKLT